MRYAIISDLHANMQAMTAVLEAVDAREIDQIVCLGDVVGYNADPNECVELIRRRKIPTVCGNHDAVACGMEEPYGFNPVALNAALWTREHLTPDNVLWLRNLPDLLEFDHFLAVHGSPEDRDCYLFVWEDVLPHFEVLKRRDRPLCFFGHTHSPGIYSTDGMYTVDADSTFPIGEGKAFFINPGSVGQPRDGDPRASFGILDTDMREFELVRVPYDIQSASERIRKEGLPPFLAERLFEGR